jgi:hypothetical protein
MGGDNRNNLARMGAWALAAVLPGRLRAKALQLQADYQNRIHELLAPEIFIAETANALTKANR